MNLDPTPTHRLMSFETITLGKNRVGSWTREDITERRVPSAYETIQRSSWPVPLFIHGALIAIRNQEFVADALHT